jgi:hypothetical protein
MREQIRSPLVAVLIAIVAGTVCGCNEPEDSISWNVHVRDSGDNRIYHFIQPKLVLLLDGLAAGDGESGYQIRLSGDGWGAGSGIGAYYYENGVASLDVTESYKFRITDRGTKFWSGDRVIATPPYDERTVIALDTKGNPREFRDGERERIIEDAKKPGLLSEYP